MIRADILDHRVLACLRAARSQLNADQIADVVYRDDPTGGPETADQSVRFSIRRLRERGQRIISKRGRKGGFVYLGYEDPAAAREATAARQAMVKAMRDKGAPILRISERLGLPPQVVASDLDEVGLGRGWQGRPTTGRAA